MLKKYLNKTILNYIYLVIISAFVYILYKSFDINQINYFISENQVKLEKSILYAVTLIFILRAISIIIPILPGTYCSVISGYLFGVKNGLLIIFIADFFACSFAFFVSRNLGRDALKRILGNTQMSKIEQLSKNYFEQNIFLMTGFLMTSWFDFVSYAIGLTKIPWKKFMPALIISILISDLPFVAGGYSINQLKDNGMQAILKGDLDIIKGPYLIILIISVLVAFCLGLLNIYFTRKSKII
ncbi:TVP38/TMEM64 family protein [Prochlorococcus sp. MIT 1223]|uniref:TVP38/TMEM64 family protein n=1 Tax=Prochlorococcus sp. MIT 1223 TaxID=3096217 RepID=UPI002A7514FF|nr:VTT domain-containing protein [Prochlorococcus sp. MIT 1223]